MVGDVFYMAVWVIGNNNLCPSQYTNFELAPPAGTKLAIGSQHPVRCWAKLPRQTTYQRDWGSCPQSAHGSWFDQRIGLTWYAFKPITQSAFPLPLDGAWQIEVPLQAVSASTSTRAWGNARTNYGALVSYVDVRIDRNPFQRPDPEFNPNECPHWEPCCIRAPWPPITPGSQEPALRRTDAPERNAPARRRAARAHAPSARGFWTRARRPTKRMGAFSEMQAPLRVTPAANPEGRPNAGPPGRRAAVVALRARMRENSRGGALVLDSRFDVFLSHSSRDKPTVERIARGLRDAGIEPWLDTWCLTPGGDWQTEIADGIRSSRSCAVFIGSEGLGDCELQELGLALDRSAKDRHFRVFAVLLPGVEEPFDPTRLPPSDHAGERGAAGTPSGTTAAPAGTERC